MPAQISYLCSPFYHPDERVKRARVDFITRIAYRLMSEGHFVFSPLTHNVPLIEMGLENSWDQWGAFDLEMVARCDRLLVVKIPGWETSRGMRAEIEFAKAQRIPVEELALTEEEKQWRPLQSLLSS